MIPKLYQNKTYYIDVIFKKVVAILKDPRKLSLTALTDQMESQAHAQVLAQVLL